MIEEPPNMSRFPFGSLFAAAILLAVPALAEEQPDLTGSEWGYPGKDRPFIAFRSEMRLVGNGGCNNLFGNWQVHDGDQLELGPIGTTRMACLPEIMEQEAEFLAKLEAVTSYRIVEGRMQLFADGVPWTEMERRDRD
jgi:heat shock protein HslJ